jgi:serine/threonine protein kinase
MASSIERGTMLYWPPERYGGEPYDERTDVWSLGITLAEIVYGDFLYKNSIEVMNRIKNRTVTKL